MIKNRIWRTRDGREIPISEMTTQHIRNTLVWLREEGYIGQSTVSFYLSCPEPLGEMAQVAFDEEFDAVLDASVCPFIDVFEGELRRRGVEP